MTRWTPQHVAALAPDASSLAAARRLARPGPWSDTGSTDTLVWGKCQGSGATPYRVSVDVTGPDFRCSCPSRKLPCKHGLALLMLWATGSGSVSEAAEPAGHAAQWAAERSKRAGAVASLRAARAGLAAQAHRAPDPKAQAKRLEERLALMTAGMEDFSRWLGDLARSGTAGVRSQPYTWWDTTAARLVDAQLPGLADQVRSMGPAPPAPAARPAPARTEPVRTAHPAPRWGPRRQAQPTRRLGPAGHPHAGRARTPPPLLLRLDDPLTASPPPTEPDGTNRTSDPNPITRTLRNASTPADRYGSNFVD
ncbi:SWIM zinc finger family protein [Intrasporangium calvum]|nr:SWIM zinc finger family protein [Intrasporangium calvum]